MSTSLRLESVSYRYEEKAVLENVSLQARSGELIALLGRNGAGKSTLLDIAAGLRLPLSGRVVLDEQPLPQWRPQALARSLCHLPQGIRSNLPFTVEQLVLMGRYPLTDRWFETDGDRAAVEQALTRTQCTGFRGRRVSTLSGGERQRVLLAACLAQRASVLLLDEPSAFLDIDQQLHCFSLLQEEASRGALCIIVTHDINMALAYCTRILVLADRRIAADTPANDAAATSNWLPLFSPRLELVADAGRPWVRLR